MKYSLNLECYRESFTVPSCVVHQHLKLAGALQIKVLLWVCANKGLCDDINQIAADLGATSSDVQDALQYWLCNNVICQWEAPAAKTEPVAELKSEQPLVSVPAPPAALHLPKPSRAEVARRSAESDDVSFLMCEAQQKFGRTLSQNDASTLLWLMDTHGISPAILLTVINYAVSVEKCNIKFIQATAIDWANNDIDTVEKAEQHLTKLEQSRSDWYIICRIFGIDKRKATAKEEIYVERWLHTWNFSNQMLKCAYDSCVNSTGKLRFAYVDKVLNTWYTAGFKKPEDITDTPAGGKATAKKQLKKASAARTTSYDINELEELI